MRVKRHLTNTQDSSLSIGRDGTKTQNSALSTIQKFEEKCMKYGLHPLNPYAPGTRDAEVWEEGSQVNGH